MRQLIITCDDCGISEGINQATFDLYQKGMATTASIMTNLPATQHAFDLFADCPALGLGVHLNLTDGFALVKDETPSALVYDDGRFRSRLNLWTRIMLPYGRFYDQVRAEFTAQIEVFLRAGLQPQHLTTHRHFHILPAMRDLVIDLAREYDIPWVRAYSLRDTSLPVSALSLQKRTTRSPEATAHDAVAIPDHLIALRFWLAEEPQALLDELLTLEGNIELVAHPGYEEDETFPADLIYLPSNRAEERRYLEAFCALLQAQAADQVRVADLVAGVAG